MRINTKISVAIIISFLAFNFIMAQNSYNYEEMEMEQYNALLGEWQQKLETHKAGIDNEQKTIDSLNAKLASTQEGIDSEWNEIFTLTGLTKDDYDSYGNGLNQLRSDASALLSLSPEQIYERMNEVDSLQAKLDRAKKSPFSVMSDNAKTIAAIQSMIDQTREKGKAAVPPSYTVVRGDYLWKIAGKEDIYGDSYAWMRIYTSNKDQIKDPNMIFVNQVFNIPHQVGPNEYLVAKGDNLSKIAGLSNVYGSSFKWQKLYEANKATIADPNVVYPYQLLQIAR
jgi:nucleoid-associated protein YgaU